MSGVYIKGMEMPTDSSMIVAIRPDGMVEDVMGCYVGKAVPVPPHGDLIERKAAGLTDFEIVMCDGDYKDGMKMLLEKIESAPTIIPASEEGET